jgi:hypothetical protein
MDLKQHMRQQEIWSNKIRKEEIKEQEGHINEKLERRKEEVIMAVRQEQ